MQREKTEQRVSKLLFSTSGDKGTEDMMCVDPLCKREDSFSTSLKTEKVVELMEIIKFRSFLCVYQISLKSAQGQFFPVSVWSPVSYRSSVALMHLLFLAFIL